MDNMSLKPAALSTYLTVYQVYMWIRFRTPEAVEERQRDYAISNHELKALQEEIAGKAVAKSRSLDALLQLSAALEAGRVKATGRLNWIGNPRVLPAHYWPHLTLANRNHTVQKSWIEQICACFRIESRRDFWSDLRFDAKRVLMVWPTPADRRQQREQDGARAARIQRGGLEASNAVRKRELRSAPDPVIHKAISGVYDEAERAAQKPPNVKEIVVPVQKSLSDQGYEASGRRIQQLADADKYRSRRRRPGATMKSERRREQR
jgi:hypothetical protein